MKSFKISVPNKEHREPIPEGSSRYWELGNPNDICVCVGGMGPIYFEENVKVSELIDFQNKVSLNSFYRNLKKERKENNTMSLRMESKNVESS